MIISIKYVIRFAKAEMIYEMPYSRGTGTFTLAARGKYGLAAVLKAGYSDLLLYRYLRLTEKMVRQADSFVLL